jgi:hypothetical protein
VSEFSFRNKYFSDRYKDTVTEYKIQSIKENTSYEFKVTIQYNNDYTWSNPERSLLVQTYKPKSEWIKFLENYFGNNFIILIIFLIFIAFTVFSSIIYLLSKFTMIFKNCLHVFNT